jgi:hypothetical protein
MGKTVGKSRKKNQVEPGRNHNASKGSSGFGR